MASTLLGQEVPASSDTLEWKTLSILQQWLDSRREGRRTSREEPQSVQVNGSTELQEFASQETHDSTIAPGTARSQEQPARPDESVDRKDLANCLAMKEMGKLTEFA